MDLTNAYANEVAILLSAMATLCLIVWMIRDTYIDWQNAVIDRAPGAWVVTGFGRIAAEVWRLFNASLFLWIGWWMTTHPPPDASSHFFDPVQFNPGRNIIALLVVSNAMAAFTDRWYRRRAKVVDGIRGVRKS